MGDPRLSLIDNDWEPGKKYIPALRVPKASHHAALRARAHHSQLLGLLISRIRGKITEFPSGLQNIGYNSCTTFNIGEVFCAEELS